MPFHLIRSRLPQIASLLAVWYLLAQVFLTAHVATYGQGDHVHGSEHCYIGTLSNAHSGCDLADVAPLPIPERGAVIETVELPSFTPATPVARASRDPPANA